jgi:DNA-binding MarR family transcriptional regulator
MEGRFDSRNPLISLVDETTRLNGRFRSAFAESRRMGGLGTSDAMVLNAVVEAEHLPTVPQIGRSLGHPRQTIQHAVNALVARGLIETVSNPDHIRAVLLRATEKGVALKREADARADAIAQALSESVDLDRARSATQSLRIIRKQLEAQLRADEEKCRKSNTI